MAASKLNIYRWILFSLSLILFLVFVYCIEKSGTDIDSVYYFVGVISILLWFISTLSLLFFFIYKRTTISNALKRFILIIIPVSVISYLILYYIIKSRSDFVFILTAALVVVISYSTVLSFISYLEKIEIILSGLIIVIITGFVFNRFGLVEGAFLMFVGFCLSSLGFMYLVFKSIPQYKISKTRGMVFIIFYCIIAILNALFLIKFMKSNAALTNIYDIIGVIIYLVSCLALFITLPFLNFTEWPKPEKVSFKRLIIIPLVLFLFLFSLKFLLPDRIYRNIFFMEYSKKEIVHFNMKDFVVK